MQSQFHQPTIIYKGSLFPVCELINRVRKENAKLSDGNEVFDQKSLMRVTQGIMESLNALLKGLFILEEQFQNGGSQQEKENEWKFSQTLKKRLEWIPIKDFCREYTYMDEKGKQRPLVSNGFLKTLRQLVPEITLLSKKGGNGVWEVNCAPLLKLLLNSKFYKRFPKYQKQASAWIDQHIHEYELIMKHDERNDTTQN